MDSDRYRTAVVVVAAGTGSRFGASLPKQFCLLEGRPVLMHTVSALRRALPDAEIVLVLSPSMTDYWHGLCASCGFDSPRVVAGGATRWESVRNAVVTLGEDCDVVLIHDGARPIVDADMVGRVVAAARCNGVAIPVVPVTDSLRCKVDTVTTAVANSDTTADANPCKRLGATRAVDRSRYLAVQTPQGFDARVITEAYRLPYSPAFTDDASVVEAAGYAVATVDGDSCNIKITNPGDIDIAAVYLRRREEDRCR